MKVIVDIPHYSHMNFFRHPIFHFIKNGIVVDIIVQPRGNLEKILLYEYNLPYTILGSVKKTFAGKALNLVLRDISIYQYLRKSNFDVATSGRSINVVNATCLAFWGIL
jgi:predicted glycosyltransferase